MPIAAADIPNTPKGSSARPKASLFNTALSFLCGGSGGGIDGPASPVAAAAGKDACRFKLSDFDSNSTAISDWVSQSPNVSLSVRPSHKSHCTTTHTHTH